MFDEVFTPAGDSEVVQSVMSSGNFSIYGSRVLVLSLVVDLCLALWSITLHMLRLAVSQRLKISVNLLGVNSFFSGILSSKFHKLHLFANHRILSDMYRACLLCGRCAIKYFYEYVDLHIVFAHI